MTDNKVGAARQSGCKCARRKQADDCEWAGLESRPEAGPVPGQPERLHSWTPFLLHCRKFDWPRPN